MSRATPVLVDFFHALLDLITTHISFNKKITDFELFYII